MTDSTLSLLIRFRRMSIGLLAVFLLVLLPGCGGSGSAAQPTGNITGKVILNGNPLTEGRVNFVSPEMGVGAGGDLDSDGAYSLEGPLPVGEYQVFITFNTSPAKIGTPAEDVMKSVPEKYRGQATSDLIAKVETGSNEYNFDLK